MIKVATWVGTIFRQFSATACSPRHASQSPLQCQWRSWSPVLEFKTTTQLTIRPECSQSESYSKLLFLGLQLLAPKGILEDKPELVYHCFTDALNSQRGPEETKDNPEQVMLQEARETDRDELNTEWPFDAPLPYFKAAFPSLWCYSSSSFPYMNCVKQPNFLSSLFGCVPSIYVCSHFMRRQVGSSSALLPNGARYLGLSRPLPSHPSLTCPS